MCIPMPDAVIFQAGALQLRWYGVFAALAVLSAYVVLCLRKKQSPMKPDDLPIFLGTCVIFGILGARLEYVRRFWSQQYAQNPMAIFRIWEGGLVFQGGFILALLAAWGLCRIRKWPPGQVGDLMAPVLPIGHAIARLGCLFNGCCFGIPWSGFCAIQYPSHGNDVLNTQITLGQLPEDATQCLPVLPIQGIEALWCLLVAATIFFCERKGWLKGQRFFLYVLGYSVGRFFLEYLRGDYHQASGLTPAQWTTVLVILPVTLAVILWNVLKTRRKSPR